MQAHAADRGRRGRDADRSGWRRAEAAGSPPAQQGALVSPRALRAAKTGRKERFSASRPPSRQTRLAAVHASPSAAALLMRALHECSPGHASSAVVNSPEQCQAEGVCTYGWAAPGRQWRGPASAARSRAAGRSRCSCARRPHDRACESGPVMHTTHPRTAARTSTQPDQKHQLFVLWRHTRGAAPRPSRHGRAGIGQDLPALFR
jgi:hypothetical protein